MEVWKQSQYVNFEVSNFGNVRNTKTGKTLKGSLSRSNEYWKVCLSLGKGKIRTVEVHRLVAETFKPNHTKGYVVDHIDENKQNNNVDNLRWISQSDNLKRVTKKKVHAPRLTAEQKQEVKDMYSTGISLVEITIRMNKKYNRNTTRRTYTTVARS